MNAIAPHSLVVEVNAADFSREVEQASTPVFVDFWAPWCAPCVALTPTFDALAETYGDQIKFVKVNIDDNRELSRRLGIRGVPCLLLFQDGQVVERVDGGRHKAFFKSLLDKYVQRPVAVAAKKTARSFRAFHGDAALREAVVERVRAHIEAEHIVVPRGSRGPVSDADQQHYSLMGAAAETADVQRFEEALGIPASVGCLQEAVHEPLIREEGEGGQPSIQFHLDPPHGAWPVEWWQAIPPGADLQALPSRFIDWLLRDLVANPKRYGLDLSMAACSALESLARLHARAAQGDAPAADEWQAVRAAVGTLLKPLSGGDANRPASTMFECAEQLAWPADELEDALGDAIGQMLFLAIQASTPDGYTPEQWAEQQRVSEELLEQATAAMHERFPSVSPGQMTPEMFKELATLEAFQAMQAFAEHFGPVAEAHRAKASLSFGEHLHAGLMQALSATVSTKH